MFVSDYGYLLVVIVVFGEEFLKKLLELIRSTLHIQEGFDFVWVCIIDNELQGAAYLGGLSELLRIYSLSRDLAGSYKSLTYH